MRRFGRPASTTSSWTLSSTSGRSTVARQVSTTANGWLHQSSFFVGSPPRAKSHEDVVRGSLDFDGQLSPVGRKPRVEVRLWLHWQWRLASVLVDPHRQTCPMFHQARGVHEIARQRDRKGRHARVRAHEEAVRDGKWLPGYFELLRIKRDGQERSGARVDQVA